MDIGGFLAQIIGASLGLMFTYYIIKRVFLKTEKK